MSRSMIIVLVVLLAISPISFPTACADMAEVKSQAVFIMPISLQEIEEEAFSGTAAEIVIFPEGFLRIGDNAFEQALQLTDVYIPDTTKYIADSAFSINPDLTIHGVKGSYAQKWAKKHKVPFVADNIWVAVVRRVGSPDTNGIQIDHYIAAINPEKIIGVHERGEDEGKSKRPQDHPELNPIDYRFP